MRLVYLSAWVISFSGLIACGAGFFFVSGAAWEQGEIVWELRKELWATAQEGESEEKHLEKTESKLLVARIRERHAMGCDLRFRSEVLCIIAAGFFVGIAFLAGVCVGTDFPLD